MSPSRGAQREKVVDAVRQLLQRLCVIGGGHKLVSVATMQGVVRHWRKLILPLPLLSIYAARGLGSS